MSVTMTVTRNRLFLCVLLQAAQQACEAFVSPLVSALPRPSHRTLSPFSNPGLSMQLDKRVERRHMLLGTVASTVQLVSPLFIPSSSLASTELPPDARATSGEDLLTMIPQMPFGAPATNSTIPETLARQIEESAMFLEKQGGRDLVQAPELTGSWRLLYTNAREIRNLATGLPLGFVLGKVYQPVDTVTGYFENQGLIEHKLGLAKASNCVVGDVSVAPLGTINAAGTANTAGNRIDVFFRRITFALDEVFGQPVGLRKVIVTKQDPQAVQPANDVTFLTGSMRITRGGDDSLFVFRREPSGRPMLSKSEREALFREGGQDVSLFGNQSDAAGPPELQKLVQ